VSEKKEFKEEKTAKPSYIERAFTNFIREKITSGWESITDRSILPFTVICFSIVGLSIIGMLLNALELNIIQVPIELVKKFMIWGFLSAASFVVLGLLSAIWKKYTFQFVLVIGGVLASGYWIYAYNPDPSALGFQILKLCFLFIWVVNSCLSLFFLIFFFFTGLSGKLVTAGKSDNHVFLGVLLRLVAVGTLIFSILLIIFNWTLHAIVLGVMAIIAIGMYLAYSWGAERNATNCNFITIMGLYNFYILYQISSAITPSDQIPNIMTELLLLIFTALYSITNIATKVKDIDLDQLDKMEKDLRTEFFQKKFNIFPRLKRKIGDFSLIIMAMGLAMGYFMFILSFYIDPYIPIMGGWFGIDMGVAVFTHRVFAFVALVVFLGVFSLYKSSPTFRDFTTNKYNLRQGFKIAGDKIAAIGKKMKAKFGWGLKGRDESPNEKKPNKKKSDDEEFLDLVEEK
jgi:hypothetical protein